MAGLRVGALITSPAPASIPIWRPETGNTKKFLKNVHYNQYISGSIPDRNEIPTATPVFSGSANPTVLLR